MAATDHDPKFHALLTSSMEVQAWMRRMGLRIDGVDDWQGVQLVSETMLMTRGCYWGTDEMSLPWEALDRGDKMALRSETMWKVGWGLCGFPSLIVGPKRAAYFASTQIRDECAEMFEPPWPAFYVSLRDCPWSTQVGRERARYTGMSVFSGKAQPNDLVVLEGDVAPGSRVWTWVAHTEVNHVTVFRAMYSYNWDSKKVNPWTWSVSESSLPPDEEDVRMSQVLCQLVAGIALEFQSTEGAREAAQKRAHGKGQRDRTRQFSTRLPRGSVYVLGDDVVVDARPAVADYIAGNSSSPSVRSFVRPHPRMQAHGPGWSQRRLIRIEGYWKGPADAPVVIRTHRFGADDA